MDTPGWPFGDAWTPGDRLKAQDRNFLVAMAATVAIIAYGSLYPFAFRAPLHQSAGPLLTLLGTWNKTPGRGDFVSNILLYMPLGFFGGVLERMRVTVWRIMLVVLLGAMLSFSIELLQYYDEGRDTEATDFYANLGGTILGAICGRLFGRDIKWSVLKGVPANPVPALLLTAWLGYRLYPYVPTIDLHKYWNAIKPLVLHPSATPYAIFRQTAVWMAICVLVAKVAGRRQATLLLAMYAALTIVASILVITVRLAPSQVIGMALAFGVWRITSYRKALRVLIAAGLLWTYVVALRLEPFRIAPKTGDFGWVPFLSFMQGSVDLDVQSFFEKFFLYGTLIWLLTRAGLRMSIAALLTAGTLFITSLIELYIPGRSAEITDAVMALGAAGMMAILDADRAADLTSDNAPDDHAEYAAAIADTLTGRLWDADSAYLATAGDHPPVDHAPCPSPPLA